MKEHFLLVAAAATLLLRGGPAHADSVVIEHVTLIDGTHAAQADMTVAVEGERIATVTPAALAHDLKGHRIDARGKYLIPGLMDVHIHLRGGFDRGPTPDSEPGPPLRQEGVEALASFLYAGVTTVIDVGNRPEHILPLRADERAGRILSPRIFATGNLITYPGSHGDRIAVRIGDFEKEMIPDLKNPIYLAWSRAASSLTIIANTIPVPTSILASAVINSFRRESVQTLRDSESTDLKGLANA